MFEKITRFAIRHRTVILAAWLIILAAASPAAVRVERVFSGSFGSTEGSEAERVRTAMSEFPAQSPDTVILILRSSEQGLRAGDPAFENVMESAVTALRNAPGVARIVTYNDPGIPKRDMVGADGKVALALVGLDSKSLGSAEQVVPGLRRLLDEVKHPAGLELLLSGPPAIYYDLVEAGKQDTNRAEVITLPLTSIVLVLAFGALVAAALPLVIGVISVTISLAILYLLGTYLGVFLNTFAQTVVTMVGLATGIDYALLIVARFRETLKDGLDTQEAVVLAGSTAGRTITFSGLTVGLSLAALLIPHSLILRSMGYAGVITVLVAITATLTAVPALLSFLGPAIDAPRALSRLFLGRSASSQNFWRHWPQAVLARPLLSVMAVLVVLAMLTLPASKLIPGVPGAEVLPKAAESQRGADALAEMDKVGSVNPLAVLIDTGSEGGMFDSATLGGLYRLTRDLKALPRVATVISPANGPVALVEPLFRLQYRSEETARSGPLATLADATISTGGRKVLLTVIPDRQVTWRETKELRREILTSISGTPGLEETSITFGGWAQESLETFEGTWKVFPLMIIIVLIATYLLLVIAFRSLLMPLKAVILNALSVAASYGVLVAVFQYGWGARLIGIGELPQPTRVDFLIPILLFAVIFGLSMDYEVFLVSRFRELHEEGLGLEESIVTAIERTGPIITWAAVIMVTVFLAFLSADTLYIKQTGLPLAVAILLDATLIRIILVPAFMKLAGRWNWWLPAPIEKALPQVQAKH